MRILGIDPGISGIAWAIYDDRATRVGTTPDPPDIVAWGEQANAPDGIEGWDIHQIYDCVAIELPVIFPGAGNEVRDTLLTTGIWIDRFEIPKHLRLPRATIASALHAKGDAKINAVMKKLCPALNRKCKGLTNDIRAAAAVALVAAGRGAHWQHIKEARP